MKTLLTAIFLSSSVLAGGQHKSFSDTNELGSFVMNYYRNPEPHVLFDAFKAACQSQEIAKAGSRTIMLSFFASALKADTTRQQEFFATLQTTNDPDLIYGFGYLLSMINTEFSLKKFESFMNLAHLSKYRKEFEALYNSKPLDIHEDAITKPEHLDMLWADFFAKGSEASIAKITTKLSDLDSHNAVDKIVAGSARWSLISNSVHHERVLATCKRQLEDSDDTTVQKALDEIVKEVRKRKGR